MQGWISLHRKIMNNPVWQDPYYFKLWIYCLLKASHQKHEQLIGNQLIQLKSGQFIIGRQVLERDFNKGMKPKLKLSEISLWRYLNNLEKWGMLNIKKTNKYSVITINKWDEHQQNEQQMNNKRTTDEQQMNTNNNVNNVNNKDSSPKRVYDEDSIHYKLAKKLYSNILNNNHGYKHPNLQSWANDVRLMMERDNRTEEQITYLIDWCQKDSFWKTNILSPSKLREKFDQLIIIVKEQKNKVVPFKKEEPKNILKPFDFESMFNNGDGEN